MKQSTLFQVGIVADDLTSATDGAAPFLAKGCAPLITRDQARIGQEPVVSIDTNSRSLSATEAARLTAAAIAALSDRSLLLKTIDSTLRGHIRAEIAAAWRASGRSRLVVAPAFPAAGRLTVGGMQMVHGIPVSGSDYRRDPVHPASTSDIGALVDPAIGKPTIIALEDAVPSAAEAPVLILDADSQQALNRQVARIPHPQAALWVGSPGLATALAALVPQASKGGADDSLIARRVLIVAGSANRVTHLQCDSLRAHGVAVVGDLADAPNDASILCLCAPIERQGDAGSVLVGLAAQAGSALARHGYDAVIATGGETMAAILDRIGIRRFMLAFELEPGFPVGRAERADGSSLLIAMKAGGFGSRSTLVDAARALAAETRDRIQ
ncbi:hypothetical protein AU381_20670 [Sinorhizobium glycinis]|uniref:Hrp-dependent type III effector protein n=1 Tax=Sinorhizobium glycinis TaxID=1472378 RepID=A0A178XNP7_9HYPH|nr:four-carbon acid sugar kinase family protein [Sinorhizobium glycinis]OAP36880.1 hypothetical protein AU381_20670 [Sinorhizobium glycinis]